MSDDDNLPKDDKKKANDIGAIVADQLKTARKSMPH